MLDSVYDKLSTLDSYFNYIVFGTMNNENITSNYKLAGFVASYPLSFDSDNFDPNNDILFLKKYALISDGNLDNKYLTEAGIACSSEFNPTIYNYFKLTNDEFPNGIFKPKGQSIEVSVTIYLKLTNLNEALFTAGENPFIKFLLGDGAGNKNFSVIRGHNYLGNTLINREKPTDEQAYPCIINFSKDKNLTLSFSSDMKFGETHELVYLLNGEPFARVNLENFNPQTTQSTIIAPKENYILDIGKNATEVLSIKNENTNAKENNYFCAKYATDFGDKISLPFNNLFCNETPRFLSKDGNKIFFALDDCIYAYQNNNYSVNEIKTFGLTIQNIIKIISFDKFVFIFSKTAPLFSAYIIQNNSLIKANINFSNYENYSDFENIFEVDITLSKSNLFMLAYISKANYKGYVIYFTYDKVSNNFNFDSFQTSEHKFSYVLAMYKNNFSDASIIFLRGAEHSYDCTIVTYYPDKTFQDVYSVLAYYYTKDTKEIHTKGRAVVVEKTTKPHLWIYFYPQIYRYNLEILGEEDDDYISTNTLYLIQKKNNNYEIFNLVGYNTATKFSKGFPTEINQSKIEGFEFLNDLLLIFMNDEKNKIVAYSLKEDSLLVENVSKNDSNYLVSYKKLDLPGKNNEGVIATLTVDIRL